MAAYHTSAVSLAWCIYALSQHSDVQNKVQNEVDQVLQGKEPTTLGDLDRLPYLMQVLKENMRVHTPGPFAARLLDEDLVLGWYTLPQGSTLFYPLCAIHKNPEYWNDPETFNPDRFSPENVNEIVTKAIE